MAGSSWDLSKGWTRCCHAPGVYNYDSGRWMCRECRCPITRWVEGYVTER